MRKLLGIMVVAATLMILNIPAMADTISASAGAGWQPLKAAEPGTLVLLGTGLVGLAGLVRKKLLP